MLLYRDPFGVRSKEELLALLRREYANGEQGLKLSELKRDYPNADKDMLVRARNIAAAAAAAGH
jgi:hypothetical protein